MMELPMIEEFLARSGKMRDVVAANEAGKRFLPAQGKPFEFLEESAID